VPRIPQKSQKSEHEFLASAKQILKSGGRIRRTNLKSNATAIVQNALLLSVSCPEDRRRVQPSPNESSSADDVPDSGMLP